MKKIMIIIPFYGKLPDYFDIWVDSIPNNPTIDFLFVTDLKVPIATPDNFKVLKMTFSELQKRIQSNFDFKIVAETPYQLCDYKVAYGLIFRDYLVGYDYWGHCDADQIFGDIRKYIPDHLFDSYERLYYLGHFSLYRNNEKINNFFKLPGSLFDYKTVYSTNEWYSFGEVAGTLQITLKNNISLYSSIDFCDVLSRHDRLVFYGDKVNPKHFVFYYEDGKVIRAYIKDGEVHEDEWMYIHLQKRKMFDRREDKSKGFYIRSHEYIDKPHKGCPTAEEIMNLSEYKGSLYELWESVVYYKDKIKRYLTMSKAQREIWRKQRMARPNLLWPDVALYK